MIQILYESDHLNRAKTLAEVLKNNKPIKVSSISSNSLLVMDNTSTKSLAVDTEYDLISTDPSKKKGMDTLIFWGHSGGNISLCGKSPSEIVNIVKRWKSLNPGLKTVEVLTCDGRHAKTGEEPLVRKVRNALRSGIFSSTRKIVLKALPVAVAGSKDSASILLADWETKSWCYVSAPSSGAMFTGKNQVVAIAEKFYCLREGDTSSADLALACQRLFKQKGEKDRIFSVNYGYFNTLRSQLVEVRSKDFSIGSRLHSIPEEDE